MASNTTYPIKTVVVLVQENRSFDHMIGWMKSLNAEIDGVTGHESNPLTILDHITTKIFFRDRSQYVDPDPGHSYQDIYQQVFGKTISSSSSSSSAAAANDPHLMTGFAQNAESLKPGMSHAVMNGFKPEAVPVYKTLVSEFAVFDRWFASVPASTQPNRLYVHSATSHGATSNNTAKLIEGYPQKTIFESLHDAGFDFAIYYQYPPSTLFYRNLRKLKYLPKFKQFDLEFNKDCKEGKLPNYVVIEQRYFETKVLPGNDDHPSHDVAEGQKFVKEVYEAIRGSRQWNEILFIVTYDEHGGFYDHVPTPVNGIPSPDDIVGEEPYGFKFDRLGVRVPTIMISPWIAKGTVVHRPTGPYPTSEFEHSSICATVKKIFNLPEFLTRRDAWAGTFENIVLSRETPRTDCPVTLPVPTKLRNTEEVREDRKLSEFQEELVLLAAVLKGDHHDKDLFPEKLLQGMTIKKAVDYVVKAYDGFLQHAHRCRKQGMHEDEIIVIKKRRSGFLNGICSCMSVNE